MSESGEEFSKKFQGFNCKPIDYVCSHVLYWKMHRYLTFFFLMISRLNLVADIFMNDVLKWMLDVKVFLVDERRCSPNMFSQSLVMFQTHLPTIEALIRIFSTVDTFHYADKGLQPSWWAESFQDDTFRLFSSMHLENQSKCLASWI